MLKETQHVEFKPNFNEDVVETLVAFVNTAGSKVYVGVEDSGKPSRNFTIGQESIQNWVNTIKTKTQPQINMIIHRDYRSSSDSIVKIIEKNMNNRVYIQ